MNNNQLERFTRENDNGVHVNLITKKINRVMISVPKISDIIFNCAIADNVAVGNGIKPS